jgi:hypothetical protein
MTVLIDATGRLKQESNLREPGTFEVLWDSP